MLNTLNINLKTDIKTDRATALGIKLMSQDKNNNQFILRFTNGGEPVTLDDTYTVEILTKFLKSGASRLTSATVRQDYATWEFDTAYITQDEMAYNYVYVRKSGSLVVSADANAFAFDVGLSEIDKDAGRVAEVYDENYQKYLDEFKDNVDFEEIAQAEQARKEAELLREENYEQKVDTAIVEADVESKVDSKVTELTPQITTLTAQLAQKANDSIVRKKSVPITLNDFDGETLGIIQDGSGGVPINIESVPRNSSVSIKKTTFIQESSNMYDVDNREYGCISNTGADVETTEFYRSRKFYEVSPNSSYTIKGISYVAEFKLNGDFILRTSFEGGNPMGANTFTTSQDTYKLKLIERPTSTDENKQFNEGTSLLPYEPYYAKMDDKIESNYTIKDREVTYQKTDFIIQTDDSNGINKLNPSNSTEGGYYDASTLSWVESSVFSQSEFIPCKSGDVIGFSEMRGSNGTIYGSYIVFKNIDGEIFSGIDRGRSALSITVPNDAVSFSTNYRTTFADTLMVTVNESVPDSYVPYGSLEFTDKRLLHSISEYVLSQTSASIYQSRFKSVNFIGDSITWGYSPYDGSRLPTIWPDLVAEALGIGTVRNYGISGSTLGSLPDEPRSPMVNRFAGYPDADLTIVLGGRNDWNFGVPLGTVDDTTKFTYYGALNIMMDGLITKSPNSTIVFLTPLHGSDSTNHPTKGDIIDYRNAVIEVGAKHSIPVYDLYAMSGIYPENSTSMTALMPDGRHPNVAGHEKIAHGITGFLKNI